MSTPLVTNIVPQHGEQAKVGVGSRFSLRDADTEIDRGTINVYLGTGPVFYDEAVLPEDREDGPAMYFEALSGNPNLLAERTIAGEYLRIDKNITANMQAVYRMGGLEAPAEPDAPIMFEFTLKLDVADLTFLGPSFTSGVQIGLYIGDKGIVLKFMNPGTRRVGMYEAGLTGAKIAEALFDFDQSAGLNSDGSNTYKVLWHPQLDVVNLYVKDAQQNTDQLIGTAAVSSFGTVPPQEVRLNQPWLIFGHGTEGTESVSQWKGVFLHNVITQPLVGGIQAGGHRTIITTNGHTLYDGTVLPNLADKVWVPFTEGFSPIGGIQRVIASGLELVRNSFSQSLGFYRIEPKVAGPYIIDFRAYGSVLKQGLDVETTGMELFVNDGVREVRFVFLQEANGTQYVGIVSDPLNAHLLLGHSAILTAFSASRRYRLVFLPGDRVDLYVLAVGENGMEELPLLSIPYAALPTGFSGLPSPAIGFLHNATTGDALGTLVVQSLRYSNTGLITDWPDFLSTSPTWTLLSNGGAGTIEPGTDSAATNVGFDASITEVGGVVTVTGLAFMTDDSVGHYLRILNGDNPGIYEIVEFVSATTVVIDNPSASGADSGNPTIQWEEIIEPEYFVLKDDPDGSNAVNTRTATGEIQPDNGWFVEWRGRVSNYEVLPGSTRWNVGDNGSRTYTGVSVHVSDGTNVHWVHFADGGPAIGKIVFVQHGDYPSTPDGLAANLLAIRSFESKVAGTYAVVDWSQFHLYRLEKTVGGRTALLVDEAVLIEFDEYGFDPPPVFGFMPSRIQVGHFDAEIVATSHWGKISYGFSDGFDVFTRRLSDESNLQSQFKQGINLLVEAEDI